MPPAAADRLLAHLRLGLPFYLGLGAPSHRRTYPECRVRVAPPYSPDLLRTILRLYRGEASPALGLVEEINFRCAAITVADTGRRFFFKQFPRHHAFHDFERSLRCSRVDRAWRAAHLLPRLGLLTPPAVGTAQADTTEYLATEWLPGAAPFPDVFLRLGSDRAARAELLAQFSRLLRRAHDLGVYLRDLVKNVLVREEAGANTYWLTDLDGLHPLRLITGRRLLHHMRQLAHYLGPLSSEEAALVSETYLGAPGAGAADAIIHALLGGRAPARG
jgi:hypothetical protein